MKAEDNVLVFGEERIVVRIAQPVRVLGLGLQFHQIHHINHADFQIRERYTRTILAFLLTT